MPTTRPAPEPHADDHSTEHGIHDVFEDYPGQYIDGPEVDQPPDDTDDRELPPARTQVLGVRGGSR